MTTAVRLLRKHASFGFHDLRALLRSRVWLLVGLLAAGAGSQGLAGGFLDDLTQPQEGRSRRVTSTMRVGEVRPGSRVRDVNPAADPKGDVEGASNFDNFRIAPGATHVLMDEKGPGVITHVWLTFLGPEDWRVEPKLYC